jgi:hypothetical protein
MPCNTLVLNKILKLYKILLNIYTFRLIVSLSHRWSHSEIFCFSSSPLFAYQYILVSVSQPFHALRDLHFHGCLLLQNFVRSCLIFLSVCFSHLAIAKAKQPKILCFLPVLLTAASQYILLSPGEHASISIAVWLLHVDPMHIWCFVAIGGQPTSFFTCLVAYCLFLLTFLSECMIRFFALLKFA